ncbi:tetratricopeptide repeat protein (macronuclear) [Tetrahymena thermophila SB210]|uniref:Tetratricopeptide repeat protein n=1 Tax=Tetrahymena thermophila (strain SB210) TaxID=312017 RepID=Q245S4_TETTS|nr:tetratricopeptide repeat protein [Tetrahymena thermophila SB210]EAS03559.2 tetratricopeptide repeat protein [Tetrahymena thermophila SB210]|eukprot:XP_001023804.2 tetratricopeptide repeat protein [Tetrahymena thermophila SB210]
MQQCFEKELDRGLSEDQKAGFIMQQQISQESNQITQSRMNRDISLFRRTFFQIFMITFIPMLIQIIFTILSRYILKQFSDSLIQEFGNNLYQQQKMFSKKQNGAIITQFNNQIQQKYWEINLMLAFYKKTLDGQEIFDGRYRPALLNIQRTFRDLENLETIKLYLQNKILTSSWNHKNITQLQYLNQKSRQQLKDITHLDPLIKSIQFENNQQRQGNDQKIKFQDIIFGFQLDGMLYQTSTNTTYSQLNQDQSCEPGIYKPDTRCQFWYKQTFNDPFLKVFPPLLFYDDQKYPYFASVLCKRNLYNKQIQSVLCLTINLLQVFNFFNEYLMSQSTFITVNPETYGLVYHSGLQNQTNYFLNSGNLSQVHGMEDYLNQVQADFLNNLINEIKSRYLIFHSELKDQITLTELFDESQFQKTFEYQYQQNEYYVILNVIRSVDKSIIYPQSRPQDSYMANDKSKQDGTIKYKIKNVYLFIEILQKNLLTKKQIELTNELDQQLLPISIIIYCVFTIFLFVFAYYSCFLGNLIDTPIEHLTKILEMIKFDEKKLNPKVMQMFQLDQIFHLDREMSSQNQDDEQEEDYERNENLDEMDSQSNHSNYKKKKEFFFHAEDMKILFMSFQSLFQTLNFTLQNFFDVNDEGCSTLLKLNQQAYHFNRFNNYRALGVLHNNMGNIHLNNRRFKEAVECYQKAIICSNYELSFYEESMSKKEKKKYNLKTQNTLIKGNQSEKKNQSILCRVLDKISKFFYKNSNDKFSQILNQNNKRNSVTQRKSIQTIKSVQQHVKSKNELEAWTQKHDNNDQNKLNFENNFLKVETQNVNSNQLNSHSNLYESSCQKNKVKNEFNQPQVVKQKIQNDSFDSKNQQNNSFLPTKNNRQKSTYFPSSFNNNYKSEKTEKKEVHEDKEELFWNLFNRKFNLTKALLQYFLFYNFNKEYIWDGISCYFEELLEINRKYLNNKKECTFIVNFYYISFLILINDVSLSKEKQKENLNIFYDISNNILDKIEIFQKDQRQNTFKNQVYQGHQKKIKKNMTFLQKINRETLFQFNDQYINDNKQEQKNNQKLNDHNNNQLSSIFSQESLEELLHKKKYQKQFFNVRQWKFNKFEYTDIYSNVYYVLDQYYNGLKYLYNKDNYLMNQQIHPKLENMSKRQYYQQQKSHQRSSHSPENRRQNTTIQINSTKNQINTRVNSIQNNDQKLQPLSVQENRYHQQFPDLQNNQDSKNKKINSIDNNQLENIPVLEKQISKNNTVYSNNRSSFYQNEFQSQQVNNGVFQNSAISKTNMYEQKIAKNNSLSTRDAPRLTIQNNIRFQQHSVYSTTGINQQIPNNKQINFNNANYRNDNQELNYSFNNNKDQNESQQIQDQPSKNNSIQINKKQNLTKELSNLSNSITIQLSNKHNYDSQKSEVNEDIKNINQQINLNNLPIKISQLQMILDLDSIAKYEYTPDLLCGFLIYTQSLIFQSERNFQEAIGIMTDYFEETKFVSRQLRYYLLSMLYKISFKIPKLIQPIQQMKIIYDFKIDFSIGVISTCKITSQLKKTRILIDVLLNEILNISNNDQFGLICQQSKNQMITFDEIISMVSIQQIKSAQKQYLDHLNSYIPQQFNLLSSSCLFDNNFNNILDLNDQYKNDEKSNYNKDALKMQDRNILQLNYFNKTKQKGAKSFTNLDRSQTNREQKQDQTKQLEISLFNNKQQQIDLFNESHLVNDYDQFTNNRFVTFESEAQQKNGPCSLQDLENQNIRQFLAGTQQYSYIKSKQDIEKINLDCSQLSEIKYTTNLGEESPQELDQKISKYNKILDARNNYQMNSYSNFNIYEDLQKEQKTSINSKTQNSLDIKNKQTDDELSFSQIQRNLSPQFYQTSPQIKNNLNGNELYDPQSNLNLTDIKSNINLIDQNDQSNLNLTGVKSNLNQIEQNVNKSGIKASKIIHNQNIKKQPESQLDISQEELKKTNYLIHDDNSFDFNLYQKNQRRQTFKQKPDAIEQNQIQSRQAQTEEVSQKKIIDISIQSKQKFQLIRSKTQFIENNSDQNNQKNLINKYHTQYFSKSIERQKRIFQNQDNQQQIQPDQFFHQGVRKGISSFFCQNNELNQKYKKIHQKSKKYIEKDQDTSDVRRSLRKKYIIYITDEQNICQINFMFKSMVKELQELQIELLVLKLNQQESIQEYHTQQNQFVEGQIAVRYFYDQNKLAEYIFNQRETQRYRNFPLMYEHYSNNFWLVNLG